MLTPKAEFSRGARDRAVNAVHVYCKGHVHWKLKADVVAGAVRTIRNGLSS